MGRGIKVLSLKDMQAFYAELLRQDGQSPVLLAGGNGVVDLDSGALYPVPGVA